MSTADYRFPQIANGAALPLTTEGPKEPVQLLHRLKTVRCREGVSRSTMARRLGIPLREVKRQEEETTDISLSTLHKWQEILQVPLAELLVEANDPLSVPVMKRAKLIRLMKTAQAIRQRTREESIGRMAQVLVEQLLEVMPELEEVTPWPEVGQPRTLNELGQAANRRLPEDVLSGLADTA